MLDNFVKKFMPKNWIFYVFLILILAFIVRNPDISLTIFAALVFACSLNPLVDKLSKKMPRGVAAPVVLLASIGFLGILFIPLIISCIYEIGTFASAFPGYIDQISDFASKNSFLQGLGLEKIDWDSILNSLAAFSANIINNTVVFFKSLSSIFLYLLLTFIFTFYLLVDRESIKQSTLRLVPDALKQRADEILETIAQRLGGYIFAQVCAIISVGFIMLIGLSIFKIPYAPILALITAILDIIPVVGPALALIICLVSTYQAGAGALVIVILTFIAAQLIENNAVRPYIFGKLLNIHPMLIFIFLFVATKYLGIAGALFAPAIAAAMCVLVDELYIKNLK